MDGITGNHWAIGNISISQYILQWPGNISSGIHNVHHAVLSPWTEPALSPFITTWLYPPRRYRHYHSNNFFPHLTSDNQGLQRKCQSININSLRGHRSPNVDLYLTKRHTTKDIDIQYEWVMGKRSLGKETVGVYRWSYSTKTVLQGNI